MPRPAVRPIRDVPDAASSPRTKSGRLRSRQPRRFDPDSLLASTVSVSRGMLYLVGGLIVTVAVLAFLLGLSMGRLAVANRDARGANAALRITGRITYMTKAGEFAGDSEAVIVVVPVGRRPDEKLAVAPLRPDAPPLDRDHPTLLGIRSMGGDFARARANGEFAVEVPAPGEYFVLLLSSHAQRAGNRLPTTVEMAQIARYFQPADALLGPNAFRWSKEVFVTDTNLEHRFIGS